jgi:UDP-N-acetylglucosamine 2-epimerase
VLACLSWGLADEETEKLIQAARMCGPDVAWWWRLHPVESGKRSAFAARLQQQGLDGSQVGAATDLPLYALVRSADVTVAHSSTVIQEAAQLGVPSVVTSDYGAEFHAGLVHAGQALKATTPAAIAEAVRKMSARPRSDSPLVVQGDLLQVAVDDFFNSVPRHQPRSDPDPA